MSMWRKTLEYLGLVEEAEEYDEMPERLDDNGGHARPAMHDTTGPIEVVRVDAAAPDERPSSRLAPRDAAGSSGRGRTSRDGGGEAGRLRPVDDLTEPVSVVSDEPRGRAGRPSRSRSEDRGASRSGGDRAGGAGNVRQLRPDAAGTTMPGGMGRRVAIVAVADYEGGAREVGQRYRTSVPVLFDLTDAPVDDRRRVLDFVAGVTYALHGEMVKVGRRSFLIVPEGGQVPESEWERLASLGYRP